MTTLPIDTTAAVAAVATPTARKSSSAPALPSAPPSPGGRIPTLLQTASPAEDPATVRAALVSWLSKVANPHGVTLYDNGVDLVEKIIARAADALLAHFDLVPRGLGVVIRDAAREMYTASPAPTPADLASLGPAVLLAIHEAYAPELSRPSVAEAVEAYHAERAARGGR